jgi:hypothetical protein
MPAREFLGRCGVAVTLVVVGIVLLIGRGVAAVGSLFSLSRWKGHRP